MYPDSILQWLGAVGIVFGLVIALIVLAVWLHDRFTDDDGRASVWYVFEVLSAVFVITGLLVVIHSDHQFLRAIAGVALVTVASAAGADIALRIKEGKR